MAQINNNNIMQEIQNPKNWKKTRKKQYSIYACRPLPGTECYNELEDAHYKTDQNRQFILSGTEGENWVISVDKLAQTYTFEDGAPITPDSLKKKCSSNGQIDWVKIKTMPNSSMMWAFHLPLSVTNFPVKTSWGDVLYANKSGQNHLKGDFLLCENAGGHPDLSHIRVINGRVFPRTYDLHAFPNMFDNNTINIELQVPKKKFVTNITTDRDFLYTARCVRNVIMNKCQPQLFNKINIQFYTVGGRYDGQVNIARIETKQHVLKLVADLDSKELFLKSNYDTFKIANDFVTNDQNRDELVAYVVERLNSHNKSNLTKDNADAVKKNAKIAYTILKTLNIAGINVPEPTLRLDGDDPDAFIELGKHSRVIMIYGDRIDFIYFDTDINTLYKDDINNKDNWKQILKQIAHEINKDKEADKKEIQYLGKLKENFYKFISKRPIMRSYINNLEIPQLWIDNNFRYNKGEFTTNGKEIGYGLYVENETKNGMPQANVYVGYILSSLASTPIMKYGHGGYEVDIVQDPTQQDYKEAFSKCEAGYYAVH